MRMEQNSPPNLMRERVWMNDFTEIVTRDGIPVEKGVVLTREYLDANQELFTKYLDLWIRYPDLLLDMI